MELCDVYFERREAERFNLRCFLPVDEVGDGYFDEDDLGADRGDDVGSQLADLPFGLYRGEIDPGFRARSFGCRMSPIGERC